MIILSFHFANYFLGAGTYLLVLVFKKFRLVI